MIRKHHNHTSQTNPRHYEEKSQNIYSNKTSVKVSKWCKYQESIQSSTTPDPGYQWESDKLTADTTNESQEGSPFPAGDHKAHINRRAQRHSTKQKKKHTKYPLKKYRFGTVSKIFYLRAQSGFVAPTSPLFQMWIKTHKYLVCMKDP